MNIVLLGILMDAFFIVLLGWCSYLDIKNRIISNKVILLFLCLVVIHLLYVFYTSKAWLQYPSRITPYRSFLHCLGKKQNGCRRCKAHFSSRFVFGTIEYTGIFCPYGACACRYNGVFMA